MSYLSPHFKHDLFVSYSHGDFQQTGTSPLKDWTREFVQGLFEELQWNTAFRDKLTIFLDQNDRPGQGVDPTVHLPEQLSEGIAKSALLCLLVCNPYLQSAWCARELEMWLGSRGSDLAEISGRIFPIVVGPVEDDSWPDALLDENRKPLPGFFFHDRKQKNPDLARPYKYRGLDTNAAEYHDELMKVVSRLTVKLKELRETLDRQERLRQNARQLEEGGLVYLHARTQDAMHWQRASRDLFAGGYAVLPNRPEAEASDDLDWRRKDRDRVETLIGCDALLLVCGDQEDVISRDISAVGRHSRHAAKARSDKLLPCAVYDGVGAATRSDEIRRTAQQLGIEWIDASSGSGWIGELRSWQRQVSEQLRRTA